MQDLDSSREMVVFIGPEDTGVAQAQCQRHPKEREEEESSESRFYAPRQATMIIRAVSQPRKASILQAIVRLPRTNRVDAGIMNGA